MVSSDLGLNRSSGFMKARQESERLIRKLTSEALF